ncbi:hypothetical protein CEE37_11295 [candidate division LCP-89 bacterium B3_LCP]|uniref:Secretion system C-terminal sorting domain-containing protein n=1 Tax=candidate division LCP-89 bacterium B3_LCP TaxID=2012998 RepID=A0A532UY48_UNCL8|nr:MAG: hypothetical protein CEE37_11295 [candidate division LCP-89 bacterium B3_LCP]
MRFKIFILLTLLISLAFMYNSQAYWPATIRENLPVATTDSLHERYPFALPYPDNSTLIVYNGGWLAGRYQIVDKYGQLKYAEPESVYPLMPYFNTNQLITIPDGEDGAIICWRINPGMNQFDYYAQKLDSQGNRLWGDSASLVLKTFLGGYIDISSDGNGGFFLAIDNDDDNIVAQHIDEMGNPLYGDSGRVVLAGPQLERFPKVTQDGSGGFYVVWDDWRPPYNIWGSLHMQRFDSEGNPMWSPRDGVFLCQSTLFHQIIPDGEGGFILHANPENPYYNNAKRVSPDGQVLWNRDHVSWYVWTDIFPGEPGFFYLGFLYGNESEGWGIYGQRMDIQGHTYWPTWGSGQVGAEFGYFSHLINGNSRAWHFRYPYFYSFNVFQYTENPLLHPKYLYIQALDLSGRKSYSDNGVLITMLDNSPDMLEVHHFGIAPSEDGGAVGVWCEEAGDNHFDIMAKRCNADGTLGGADPSRRPDEPTSQISGSLNGNIQYEIHRASVVKIELYNLLGQHAKTIKNSYQQPGSYTIHIDQSSLSSGIYFLRLHTPTGSHVAKMVVVR